MVDIEPRDLGLPPRFSAWRPGQLTALYRTVDAPQRFIAACMPTGSGKSVFGTACSLLFGGRTCVLTSTKILQDQYTFDFGSCGMVDVRGRQNYRCMLDGAPTCADGRIINCQVGACPRKFAVNCATAAKLVVTNYACYLHSYANGDGLGDFDLLILDEAHSIIDELCSFLEIKIDHADFPHMYSMFGGPPHRRPLIEWRKWADTIARRVKQYLDDLKRSFAPFAQIKLVDSFHGMLDRLRKIEDDWILDEKPNVECTFSPLWPTSRAEELLFRNIKRVIFLSATIVPKTTAILGVDPASLLFLASEPVFDPTRCPIYMFGAARMDFRASEGERVEWVHRMDYLIHQRLDRKGLIHTTSYQLQREIVSRSQFAPYILAPSPSILASAVGAFREAPPPRLLASPAITTGYDFPLRAAEYQFLMKVPFIDARSKVMKARAASDPEYLPSITAQILAQSAGRDMREPDDQDECFVMDAHMNWFIKKHRAFFPLDFLRRVRWPDGPPQPPPPLPYEELAHDCVTSND